MKFWDSSAVVPLLVAEPFQTRLVGLLDQDPIMLVWWATPVECTSAVARREHITMRGDGPERPGCGRAKSA